MSTCGVPTGLAPESRPRKPLRSFRGLCPRHDEQRAFKTEDVAPLNRQAASPPG